MPAKRSCPLPFLLQKKVTMCSIALLCHRRYNGFIIEHMFPKDRAMMSNRKHGNSGQTDQSLQYLPLFFCLPRALFRGHQEYMGITRYPQALLNLPAQDSVLSSSGFVFFVKKIYAEAIWKYLQIPKKHLQKERDMRRQRSVIYLLHAMQTQEKAGT